MIIFILLFALYMTLALVFKMQTASNVVACVLSVSSILVLTFPNQFSWLLF